MRVQFTPDALSKSNKIMQLNIELKPLINLNYWDLVYTQLTNRELIILRECNAKYSLDKCVISITSILLKVQSYNTSETRETIVQTLDKFRLCGLLTFHTPCINISKYCLDTTYGTIHNGFIKNVLDKYKNIIPFIQLGLWSLLYKELDKQDKDTLLYINGRNYRVYIDCQNYSRNNYRELIGSELDSHIMCKLSKQIEDVDTLDITKSLLLMYDLGLIEVNVSQFYFICMSIKLKVNSLLIDLIEISE